MLTASPKSCVRLVSRGCPQKHDAHTLKILLAARSQLVSQRQTVANTTRGLPKIFGLVIARGAKGPFPIRVREQLVGNDVLAAIVEPMRVVWQALREQVATLDRQILARAAADAAAQHVHAPVWTVKNEYR
jgi:transposase